MAGAGLKKWMPHTRSGFSTVVASSTTGRVEVLVAMMAVLDTTSPRRPTSSFFTARSSTTDSSTRSQSARAWRSWWAVTRLSTSLAAVSSMRPFSTCLARDLSRAATMASAVSCLRDRRTTSMPALAATSAMPAPMIPEPTMPRRSIDMGGEVTDRSLAGPNRATRRELRGFAGSARIVRTMPSGILALVGGGEFTDGCAFDATLLEATGTERGAGAADRRRLRAPAAARRPGRRLVRRPRRRGHRARRAHPPRRPRSRPTPTPSGPPASSTWPAARRCTSARC